MASKTVIEISEDLKTQLGEIELDVLSNVTLAQAMRMGCKAGPQLHGGFYKDESFCALQSAEIFARALGYIK